MTVAKAKCFECRQVRYLVEVPWVGITGTNEGASVCLACAPGYLPKDPEAPLQQLHDESVAVVMGLAKERQPAAPEGWLVGIAIAGLIFKGNDRASIDRIWQAVVTSTFGASEKVQS